jgi:6-phosphogluconolactonase
MAVTYYCGTYTDKKAEGIYRFDFEDGVFSDAQLFVKIGNPKYLCTVDGDLACLCDVDGRGGAAVIAKDGTIRSKCAFEDKGSCYIASRGNRIYTANYHMGTVSLLKYEDGELKHLKTILIKDKGGCHQILFHEDLVLVPSLFLDRIMIFDGDLNEKGSIAFPEGSGPRHGVFDQAHRFLYVLSELSNELFKIDMSDLQIKAQIPVLKDGVTHKEGSAAIRMSQDGRFIYASTRYEDVLSIIDAGNMELLQVTDCGGSHPRDFVLEGDYLLCANRFSDQVVSFRLKDGLICQETSRVDLPDGIALLKC